VATNNADDDDDDDDDVVPLAGERNGNAAGAGVEPQASSRGL
jgi:hypothetical protein